MSDKSILLLDKEHRKFTKSAHEENTVGWSAAAEMSNYPHKVILDFKQQKLRGRIPKCP